MYGRYGVLLGSKEFLVEFLAIAKAGEFYLDVLSTGEGYHALSQIDYLDRLAHVKDEDLASVAHGAGFEYETAGFGDEHKVADDVGMGDFDRAAFLDLLTEDWDDGAVASQDVAETCGDELGGLLMAVESLTVDLADAL